MAHPNRPARERALELLYESEAKSVHPADVVAGLPVEPVPYAASLAEGTADHIELLDHIVGARAQRWSVARMPALDRAVLRLATYELAFEPDLPAAVVIDEAVDLAKAFSTDDSPRFVNGVLAKVASDVRGDGQWAVAPRPDALVVDIDGVVRHWDVPAIRDAEAELGLEVGTVSGVAFDVELMARAGTGAITDEEWRAEVGRRVAETHGVDAADVQRVWSEIGWTIDADVVDLVREVAAAGRTTACFSNATTRLEHDLATCGVADAFATVVNSARIGTVKPEREAFTAAAAAVGVAPSRCLFVDDRHENVVGALDAGLHAVAFRGADRLRAVLRRTGLLPA